MSSQNEQLARRFFEDLCNERRLDLADEIITADHRYHDPQSPPSEPGPEGVKATVSIYQDTLEGHWNAHEIIATDDRVVTRWTGTGVHRADIMGIPATGKEIAVEAISIMRREWPHRRAVVHLGHPRAAAADRRGAGTRHGVSAERLPLSPHARQTCE